MRTRSLLALTLTLVLGCGGQDRETPGAGGSSSGGAGGSSTGGSVGSTTGGAGGSASGGGGGSVGSPSGGSGAVDSGGGAAPDAAGDSGGGPPAGGAPGAELDKWVFDVPCPPGTVLAEGNCNWPSMRAKEVVKSFGGNPATTYMVKLHVCAVSEEREATGCKATPATGNAAVCVDGTPSKGTNIDTYPSVTMKVSDPPHTYQLNTGKKKDDLSLWNYSATFEIKGGSTLTFATDGGSNSDVYTSKWNGNNFQCPGAPGITQPFEGQFFYFTIESLTPPM